ncbi:hypothetical protein [Solirhodobacter olei]|uniref:hypothetical protein n=1 Tax=Solirhodobacter olei TaxID=2493082 RepID=UPI000FDBCD10|nr:hypothetical protein [Solirhodobacter olei]
MSSFLRPEAVATLHRWREVIIAAGITALGAWIYTQGGFLFAGIGILTAGLGALLGVLGLRRMRFRREVSDPGIVRVVEGQITYMGPTEGGFAGLSLISEIALMTRNGRRVWRLSQSEAPTLYIPTAAEGAEALFDTFAGLPGLDSARILDAIEGPAEMPRIVWRRPAGSRIGHRRPGARS